MRCLSALALVPVACCGAFALVQGQVPSPTDEDVLVERVVRPVLIEPARCREITPERLVVLEDGQECRVTAVGSEPQPRVQAILIDNSVSMQAVLGRLEKAVVDYIEKVPEHEPVVVTTFADNVVLEAGLSTDRRGQIEAVRRLGRGKKSALLDALYHMMRYLEPRAERKVLIVFTDTFDNASLGRHGEEQLLALARRIPGLSVFTIHLEGKSYQVPPSIDLLQRLSRETGGEYYHIGGWGSFGKVFRGIRRRLEGEIFVTYEPAPFGAGTLDVSDGRSHRWREVEVKTRPGDPCRIVSGGVPTRLSGPSGVSGQARRKVEPVEDAEFPPEVLRGRCPPESARWRVVEDWRFPAAPAWPARPPVFSVVEPRDRLLGRALDIVEDQGARYDAWALAENGLYRLEETPATVNVREFVVELPALDFIRENLRSPVDVMSYLMETGVCAGGREEPHPMFVHGETFLELRRDLAEALYGLRDDFRIWTDGKLDQLHASRADRLLDHHQGDAVLTDDERRRLRAALLRHLERPGLESVHAFLAEWIADVHAVDLALALETRQANSRLRGPRDGEEARFDSFWKDLLAWFPAPTRARVLALLVPAYDPARDLIGFYRVVLPRVNKFGPPLDSVPERPFGVELIERMLDDATLAAVLRNGVEFEGLRFRPVFFSDPGEETAQARHPADRPALIGGPPGLPPYRAFESRVRFSATTGDTAEVTSFLVRAQEGGELRLRCLRLDDRRVDSSLKRSFGAFIERAGLACDPGTKVHSIEIR